MGRFVRLSVRPGEDPSGKIAWLEGGPLGGSQIRLPSDGVPLERICAHERWWPGAGLSRCH